MARSNPPAIPADTDPAIWRLQMAAIRRRSMSEHLEEAAALLAEGSNMEADAVRRRHPDYSEREVFLAVVRRRYGEELAFEVWPEAAGVEP